MHYPLEILLPIAKLARSTFFYHRHPKPDRDSTLKARIRDIKKAEPNEKLLTDITGFRVKDEKRYFSPILDCFNNELITYGLSRWPKWQVSAKKYCYKRLKNCRKMRI